MRFERLLAALACALLGTGAHAAGWVPQKNVEIIVGSSPGGSNDKTARQVERILRETGLVTVPMNVVNKPGGGSSIAFTYVSQHEGNPYMLMIGTTALLSNHITGRSKLRHSDFTPIASLFNDYVVFAVNAKSSFMTGRDLADRLIKDPKSVAIGFATALGSHNHIAAGLLMKALGGSPRSLKAVAYKGSSIALTNLIGGHIDLVTTAAGNTAAHVANGRLRVVAVAAPKRFGGVLADVPTWKEQGVDLVFGGWRAIMAPKGITPEQRAYWEGVLKKATEVPAWKEGLKKNYWSDDFVTGKEFAKDLDKDYEAMRSVLADLGLAKR